MNIASIIGPVDAYSAFVAAIIFGGAALATTVGIMKWQNRTALRLEHEGKKYQIDAQTRQMREAAEEQTKRELAKIAAERDVSFKKAESGLLEMQPTSSRTSG